VDYRTRYANGPLGGGICGVSLAISCYFLDGVGLAVLMLFARLTEKADFIDFTY
jgi:hypothetical protein